jgi:hypothetical protein
MTPPAANTMEQLDRLLTQLLDGELSADQQAALQALLRDRPEARQRYAKILQAHAQLQQEAAGCISFGQFEKSNSIRIADIHTLTGAYRHRARSISTRTWWAIAALVVLSTSVGYLALHSQELGTSQPKAKLAWIEAVLDAHWGEPVPEMRAELAPNRFELREGFALLRFGSGAETLIEAPSQFELLPDGNLKLVEGRVVARCSTPASRGFVVKTSDWDVIDLGTEFGVTAIRGGRSEVFVFEGEVELHNQAVRHLMSQGDGVTLGSHEFQTLPESSAILPFVRLDEFRSRLAASEDGEALWLASAYALTRDPHLLLWCDIRDEAGIAEVVNRAVCHRAQQPTLKQPRQIHVADGRTNSGKALRIETAEQAVRIQIPGSFACMTLAAWIRFDASFNHEAEHRALITADGWSVPGQLHWQRKIQDFRVTMYAAEALTEPDDFPRFSAGPDRLNTPGWHLLVSVIDGHAAQVTHYLDGQVVGRQPITESLPPIRLDNATIGAFISNGHANRFLHGLIDDVMIWSRPLSDTEIESLYERGTAQP